MSRETENRNRNRNRSNYYVEGNAVRRMEAVPDYRQERKSRQEREREEELKRRQRAARRNQEKALRMSKSYVAFLTLAVVIFGVFSGAYIKLQSDITTKMRAISRLESQITDLKADNDEAYKRINTAIDIESIKNTAINDLGMFYASENQVVYYSVDNDDYMNQYSVIPEK